MTWKLEKISASVYRIQRGRERAGHVLLKDGVYAAKITVTAEQVVTAQAASAGDAFREVVTQANRILICGENNAELAEATLRRQVEERNARVRQMADDFNFIAEQTGGPRVEVRRRRRRMPRI